ERALLVRRVACRGEPDPCAGGGAPTTGGARSGLRPLGRLRVARPERTARAGPEEAILRHDRFRRLRPVAGLSLMRALTREECLAESGASAELVDRLMAVDAVVPLADGRFDARDEVVASMAGALLDSGIALDDLAWSLDSRRFGLRS